MWSASLPGNCHKCTGTGIGHDCLQSAEDDRSGIASAQAARAAESPAPPASHRNKQPDAVRQPYYAACSSVDYVFGDEQHLAACFRGCLAAVRSHVTG